VKIAEELVLLITGTRMFSDAFLAKQWSDKWIKFENECMSNESNLLSMHCRIVPTSIARVVFQASITLETIIQSYLGNVAYIEWWNSRVSRVRLMGIRKLLAKYLVENFSYEFGRWLLDLVQLSLTPFRTDVSINKIC